MRVNYILRVLVIGTEHLVVHLEEETSTGIHSSVTSLFVSVAFKILSTCPHSAGSGYKCLKLTLP
jgi:hypothetical protein